MKMNYSKIFFLCIFSCVSNLPSVYLKSESVNFQSFLGDYKALKDTSDPININTSKVKKVTTPSPFTIHGVFFDIVKVINDGESVRLISPASHSYVTGGVLGDEDEYQFYDKHFLWASDTNEVAGTTVDGQGCPLNDRALFFNKKYKTYKDALGKPDGVVVVVFQINACPDGVTNYLYIPFAYALKKVQNAVSYTFSLLGFAIGWFALIIPYDTTYYAYPGSYVDETGKQYNNIPVIVINHLPDMCMSKKQYANTFGSFKDSAGHPLTKVSPQFPVKGRPILQLQGIKNIDVLF
ncbi:carbonic anhydrase 7-like [Planococcus citri]|uniref:carbonic anhydrase 7-like n=1 Tax=Planococcus citri TaxID=170843 RepID=UPI0031F9924F